MKIRTDLALEARELYSEETATLEEAPGVNVSTETIDSITVTRVMISNEEGENALGKPKGNYVTIESGDFRKHPQDLYESACYILKDELKKIINLGENPTVLVVGLGNWNITPDALGPKVIANLMVTRHLIEHMGDQLDQRLNPVSAIAPGVLGITGIETGEIVKGVVEKVNPNLIIAIDALASRKLDRISTTIQISDTGISPGSGVGNKRMSLNQETLGVPVIAIGVPTVVDAATVAYDTVEMIVNSLKAGVDKNSDFYTMLKNMDGSEKKELIDKVMNENMENMMVTPKEVDSVISSISNIIADGLNISLHDINLNEVSQYKN